MGAGSGGVAGNAARRLGRARGGARARAPDGVDALGQLALQILERRMLLAQGSRSSSIVVGSSRRLNAIARLYGGGARQPCRTPAGSCLRRRAPAALRPGRASRSARARRSGCGPGSRGARSRATSSFSSSALICSTTSGLRPSESRCQSSARRSLTSSISAWMVAMMFMLRPTPDATSTFPSVGATQQKRNDYETPPRRRSRGRS